GGRLGRLPGSPGGRADCGGCRAGTLLVCAVLARISDLAASAALFYALCGSPRGAVSGVAGPFRLGDGAVASPLRCSGGCLVCGQPAVGDLFLGAASDSLVHLFCGSLWGLCLGIGPAPAQRCPLPVSGGAGGRYGILRFDGYTGTDSGAAAGLLAAAA